MSLLYALPGILEESRIEYEIAKSSDYTLKEIFSPQGSSVVWQAGNPEVSNILAGGDNLAFMKYLMENRNLQGKFQLIYIDPPFFSQADYGTKMEFASGAETTKVKGKAYSDTWETGMEGYLKMLCVRFFAIRDLLAEEGCLWVHLDWHGVHYVKILLDGIFGENNFVNEVIWQYKSGGTSKRHFARKHDTLLFYSKSNAYYFNPQKEKSYNRGMKPYRFKGVKEYEDLVGWHTLVNMKDVWQIDMVGRTARERTGYATQKPEALLERIIESCSKPGDLCGDFFCGSGTFAAAAEKLKRNWICCDKGNLAVIHTLSRLAQNHASFERYEDIVKKRSVADCHDILVDVKISKMNETEDFVEIELVEFKPEMIGIAEMSSKDQNTVERLLHEDSLQLIEYWSVDFNYDGVAHRAREPFFKRGQRVVAKDRSLISDSNAISLSLVDSFGRSYHKVISLQRGAEDEKNQ